MNFLLMSIMGTNGMQSSQTYNTCVEETLDKPAWSLKPLNTQLELTQYCINSPYVIEMLHISRVAGIPEFTILEFQNFRISEFQNFRI